MCRAVFVFYVIRPPSSGAHDNVTRTHRIAISILMVAASGLLAYWLTARRHGAGGPLPAPASTPPASQAIMRSSELRHTQQGKLAWKVLIDELKLSKGGSTIAAQGLREALIYDSAGEPTIRITAKRVQGDTSRRNFRMTGEVVVTSPKGFVIKTQTVDWVNDEQRIHCPEQVLMKDTNIVISTTGLDYLLRPDQVKCPNQVRMYSGNNSMVGGSLSYDVKTGVVDILDGVQLMINPQETKKVLREWSNR